MKVNTWALQNRPQKSIKPVHLHHSITFRKKHSHGKKNLCKHPMGRFRPSWTTFHRSWVGVIWVIWYLIWNLSINWRYNAVISCEHSSTISWALSLFHRKKWKVYREFFFMLCKVLRVSSELLSWMAHSPCGILNPQWQHNTQYSRSCSMLRYQFTAQMWRNWSRKETSTRVRYDTIYFLSPNTKTTLTSLCFIANKIFLSSSRLLLIRSRRRFSSIGFWAL